MLSHECFNILKRYWYSIDMYLFFASYSVDDHENVYTYLAHMVLPVEVL